MDTFAPPGVPQSITYGCTAYYYRTLFSCDIAFSVNAQDWTFLLGHSPVARYMVVFWLHMTEFHSVEQSSCSTLVGPLEER